MKKCSKCEEESLPGLTKGKGLCDHHWAEAIWGKAWADEIQLRKREEAIKNATV
jgi:hypothetical protein